MLNENHTDVPNDPTEAGHWWKETALAKKPFPLSNEKCFALFDYFSGHFFNTVFENFFKVSFYYITSEASIIYTWIWKCQFFVQF